MITKQYLEGKSCYTLEGILTVRSLLKEHVNVWEDGIKKDANTNKLNLLETLQIYERIWNFRVIVIIRQ